MPKSGSFLLAFILFALENPKYPNLYWCDQSRRQTFVLEHVRRKKGYMTDPNFLIYIDYFKQRNPDQPLPAPEVMKSALDNSLNKKDGKYIHRVRDIKNKHVYKILRCYPELNSSQEYNPSTSASGSDTPQEYSPSSSSGIGSLSNSPDAISSKSKHFFASGVLADGFTEKLIDSSADIEDLIEVDDLIDIGVPLDIDDLLDVNDLGMLKTEVGNGCDSSENASDMPAALEAYCTSADGILPSTSFLNRDHDDSFIVNYILDFEESLDIPCERELAEMGRLRETSVLDVNHDTQRKGKMPTKDRALEMPVIQGLSAPANGKITALGVRTDGRIYRLKTSCKLLLKGPISINRSHMQDSA